MSATFFNSDTSFDGGNLKIEGYNIVRWYLSVYTIISHDL